MIATIVTYLEMRSTPAPAPLPDSALRLARLDPVDLSRYRALFRRVGAPWLWYSRLLLDDAELGAIFGDARAEVFAVEDDNGEDVGLLELDLREAAACELAYFGLIPELAGRGHGRWLMAHALRLAWRPGVARVHVHTCTLDHPRALGFYRAAGFVARGTVVESFPDPRLAGVLPREAAPHVPVIEPS